MGHLFYFIGPIVLTVFVGASFSAGSTTGFPDPPPAHLKGMPFFMSDEQRRGADEPVTPKVSPEPPEKSDEGRSLTFRRLDENFREAARNLEAALSEADTAKAAYQEALSQYEKLAPLFEAAQKHLFAAKTTYTELLEQNLLDSAEGHAASERFAKAFEEVDKYERSFPMVQEKLLAADRRYQTAELERIKALSKMNEEKGRISLFLISCQNTFGAFLPALPARPPK